MHLYYSQALVAQIADERSKNLKEQHLQSQCVLCAVVRPARYSKPISCLEEIPVANPY